MTGRLRSDQLGALSHRDLAQDDGSTKAVRAEAYVHLIADQGLIMRTSSETDHVGSIQGILRTLAEMAAVKVTAVSPCGLDGLESWQIIVASRLRSDSTKPRSRETMGLRFSAMVFVRTEHSCGCELPLLGTL